MKTALLGFFSDYEAAELARTRLLLSDLPIDRIALTAVQGPGQSRMRTMPAARDTLLSSLRALFKHERDPARAEHLADRMERGAATVSAYANNSAAAARVAAILRECGATDIIRDSRGARPAVQAQANHEAAWPSYLWPAT